VVALIAVLPEYSVDMYFTWQAGKFPSGSYAQYAVANMTGANRLLIGVAWGAIALLFWFRFRRAVELEEDRRTELFFLLIATVYAFLIPLKGTLAWYDAVVFLSIYGVYLIMVSRRCCCECDVDGPAELIVRLPKTRRRLAIAGVFLFSAGAIFANAEPFCEGLIGTGKVLGVSEFLLVQWLAPIASEAPEFIVALMFAWRGQAGLALGSLLSAKLNQWTLLVGMIPAVYGVSHRSLEHPIPMGHFQMSEIMLTAAQSLLAVILLAGLRFSVSGSILLVALFAGQLILPTVAQSVPGGVDGFSAPQIHPVFSLLYLSAAAALFFHQPRRVLNLFKVVRAPKVQEAPEPDIKTPHCLNCKWRLAAHAGAMVQKDAG
jgi:cation:H+ antiporter